MNGSLKSWLQMELARNAAQRNKEKQNHKRPGHTVLELTWSMVASFREQGISHGPADPGRMQRINSDPS